MQYPDGHYEPVRRPLTDYDLECHFTGDWSLGTYVVKPETNTVSYVVFDLDTYDEGALGFLQAAVAELVLSVRHVGEHPTPSVILRSLLLENSGGKGYHIWLFLSEPLPAAQVRAWVEPVRTAYDAAAIAGRGGRHGWPTLEIFPKQDEVLGGYGNLVKLPLGVHAKTGRRSEIVGCTGGANSVETVVRLDSSLVPQLTERQRAPQPSRTRDGQHQPPFACVAKIVEDGAPSGCRDNAMVHLAHYCWGTGVMDYEQVLETCLRANEEFHPPLSPSVVAQKVQSAQRLTASHPSCRADWLRGFCPGGENCYAPGNVRGNSSEESEDYMSLSPEERRLRRLGSVGA